jgi:D-alanyl-D-alanine dipeptidase
LVEALAALGGPNGLQGTIGFIDKASTSLETFIRRFGVGVAQAKALLSGDLKGFAAIGQAEANRGKTPSGITPSIAAELKKAAIEKAAAKRAKEQAALTAKNTKAVAGLTALQKANGLFELDQIQLVAALKGKLSEEDRTRAELQLAILQGNTAEASKLAAEVAKAQGLTANLVAFYSGLPNASNPFLGWIETLKQAAALAAQIAAGNYGVTTPNYNGAAIDTILSGYGSMPSPAAAGVSATGDVNVYVAGSVVSEGDLVELVRNGLLNGSLSGSASSIGRLKGSFAG